MTSTPRKYRSRAIEQSVIAFSVSYQRENLLARGMGLEHLRELLIRLARPILRQGASLAYGGHWKETEDNFTYDLLRLISAEQEDNSLGGSDTNLQIGILYNHSAWPHYLGISRTIEAQWINACRIVRVTQQQAGFGGVRRRCRRRRPQRETESDVQCGGYVERHAASHDDRHVHRYS